MNNPLKPHRPTIMSREGVVVAGHHLAAQTGVQILRAGGNAVDAAVAAAAVLTVTKPDACGLGGDLFALVYNRSAGLTRAYLGSGAAPQRFHCQQFLNAPMPNRGPLAVSVPGMVAGWEQLAKEEGRLSFSDILQPAIEAASCGFPVSFYLHKAIANAAPMLSRCRESTRLFLPDGKPPSPGETLRQPELAKTLLQIAELGAEYFYRGELGERITAHVRSLGGALGRDDMRQHKTIVAEPLESTFRGLGILTVPPVSPGLATLIALNILEGYSQGSITPEYAHICIEAMKLALADLREYIADPSTTGDVTHILLDKEYAARRRSLIRQDALLAPPAPGCLKKLGGDTAYVGVVDREGNAVSLIQSVFWDFGSGITVPNTGVILNNRMSSFDTDPSSPNCVSAGKRPLHTLQSLLLMNGDRLLAVMGCPGGKNQGQLQFNFQILSHIIDAGLAPQVAVEQPRWRFEGGKSIAYESNGPRDILEHLSGLGHDLQLLSPLASELGSAKLIWVDPRTGTSMAAADPRREAYAVST